MADKFSTYDQYAAEDRVIYEKIREHREPYQVEMCATTIEILPDVFSPHYFTDSEWFACELAHIVGERKFLEIGCGTGICALACALNGATVVCTDINPAAVRNTQLNFTRHGFEFPVLLGSVFDPIPAGEKFDVIFWNHPFFEGDKVESDLLLRAGFDPHYQGVQEYITRGRDFLTEGGSLLLGTGNAARLSRIEEITKSAGLKLNLLATTVLPVSSASTLINDYRIYELTP